jgi:hypothetical protein
MLGQVPPMAKKQTKKVVPENVSVPLVNNPNNVQSVYCNVMQMSASLMDVRLLFNEIINKGDTITVEQRANIVMSHQHFRAMVEICINGLRAIQHAESESARSLAEATKK